MNIQKRIVNICFVSASRTDDFFWMPQFTSDVFQLDDVQINLTFDLYKNNTQPISSIYNMALAKRADYDYMVFIHDDIVINNLVQFFRAIINSSAPVLGVAGATGFPKEGISPLSWYTQSSVVVNGTCPHQAGDVYHKIANRPKTRSLFGGRPSAKDAKAIDGLCIIFSKEALNRIDLTFDPHFTFDFYDLDISYLARQMGLRIDIIDVGSLLHYSAGDGISKPRYKELEKIFREKWDIPIKTY